MSNLDRGSGLNLQLILIEHHHMRIDFSIEFPGFQAFGTLLFIIALLFLISNLGPNNKVLEKGDLFDALKGGISRQPNSVYNYHPALYEPKLLGLKDHRPG